MMVAADYLSGDMVDTLSFFKDFQGAQLLRDVSIRQYFIAECEFERLQDVFKYADDINIAKGLIYLKYLHNVIKKQIVARINDDVPLEDIVYRVLINVVKNYMKNRELNRQVFSRLPQSHLEKIKEVLENIIERLPNNFFKKAPAKLLLKNNEYDPCQGRKPIDPIFYIPLKEDFPELDKTFEKSQKNDFSLLYIKPKERPMETANEDSGYPLEAMFEFYKDVISSYDYREFKAIIYTELNSSRSNDELMEYFLDTFGYAAFDFLTEIIRFRTKKIDYSSSVYENDVKGNRKNPAEMIAGQVTVQSEKESLLSKKLRKMEKKDKSKYSTIEIKQTEVEYETAKSTPIFKKNAPQKLDPEEFPHVHDQLRNHMVTTKYDGISIIQPENTIKKVTADYAEFTIPGGKKGDIEDMELVKVNSLDTTGQLVFKDIKEFNRIQSEVFPVAYHSNENILVCAPTGAGKTNIALLAIVHQIRSHMEGNLINKNDFKIVYVCPMKALATEMVTNFGKKLAPIGITVKECTGDMQLTKKEISETQMLVTTPEKWDVITRKGAVDTEVVGLVKLLIIDEVHLLNGSRGPVIEALVARTLRQVVSSQSMIRIIALSATLPGYLDVAKFLKAMVFVTSRNATGSVARKLIEIAQVKGTLPLFEPEKNIKIVRSGFKSMVRSDRLEVERLFRVGQLKVIVCTTTLAWGVNLPAHAVIIRGTLHYDATKSTFVDMDMLDVQQIFGRAGRPQYDTSGHGIIITSMVNMSKYMGLMTSQVPIESQFLNCIPDNLNAEIVLGTVSNVKEALEWLSNTFLFVRIKKNPLVYGLTYNEIWDTKQFNQFLQLQLDTAAKTLEKSQMIRFDTSLGELRPTNFGRIASFYYISYNTMELFYEKFDRHISEAGLIQLISEASEFAQIQVRMDELHELDRLRECNEYDINLDFTSHVAKVIILIQANISRAPIRVSSLISDCQFIMQTVTRLARALFEIAKDKDFALQVSRTLTIAQMLEQQMWNDVHPLMQFKELVPHLGTHRAMEILNMPISELKEFPEREMESLFRSRHVGNRVKHFCQVFPYVDVDVIVKPITEGVIRVRLLITAKFKWDHSIHGTVQHYYAWVEDPQHDSIYHMESFIITKRICVSAEPVELIFTVPLTKPLSLEYFVRVVNSQFLHSETIEVINLENLKLMTSDSFQTKILDVQPLPKTVLQNKSFEDLYPFSHFNSVQSQVFHSCYYTDTPIILGAPTGSGKTIVAELCILRQFRQDPTLKVVYIAPMKALVRERVLDWSQKFSKISKKVVEVTGDITPRSEFIRSANIIITTPEKWDAMSRNWLEKNFVKDVGLMIIDEIHLLGEDRGPVLEVIVSRMNFINFKTKRSVRIVGLSTAMANPGDLAYWLSADKRGIFNFSSAVRPVPLEIHLQGFAVKHYCPRMAAMNKSVYQAICQYASQSSALIFVSSRKQTRITGYELVRFLVSDNDPQKWVHCDPSELDSIKARLVDQDLAQLLNFGIGMHHAALTDSDRNIVEQLYVNQKIQVLIATATLAWGCEFPCQMVGRAGRPQFDTTGVACVMVQENKKNFYRKFLFEPFPVESNLLEFLPDHVNAEVANGNITTKGQLVEFIQSTFFYRRLLGNPSYYQMEPNSDPDQYVSDLADSVISTLQEHECIASQQEEMRYLYEPTFLGMLGAQYYLSFKTIYFLSENICSDSSMDELLSLICQVEEYRLLPVRHNEDNINKDLSMMNLAAARNWRDCTTKLIYICQMLIQGYMINESNIMMLPYINRENLRGLKDRLRKICVENINDLSVPVLRYMMQNKDTSAQIANIFTELLGSKASSGGYEDN
ncbi:hypothetical protein NQ314_002643 [Rhamnusium bicolor]|uniref:U5 small nuclear ribonucleoprotein 200 kDa helicase n=1 Tax=Rhamnusium bicolor TaxID=1586634 RepID=A0AAV8ZRI1_9CUCU|nr:hypothetical protein NQ314_002643 [Rhamnusium bicolor]